MAEKRKTLGSLGYAESFVSSGANRAHEESEDGGVNRQFYGKYRGTVIENVDPEGRGRLFVQVPDVLGLGVSSWAEPCVPWGGPQMGVYVVPPPLADVWVEFERGDPDHPIWVGTFWSTIADAPLSAKLAPPKIPVLIIQTLGQSKLVMSDVPVPPMTSPGILLHNGASMIEIGPASITIRSTAINIQGIVDVNLGALKVT
jgi:hypothetical protein